MPFILGAATALPKVIGAASQLIAKNKLRLQDTRPAAFMEKQQMARQAAAAPGMPGLGSMQNRLGMVQAGAVQNARLGAASGSDFLAASSGADARRQTGEQQLGLQSAQYGAQAQQRLGMVLDQDSAYRKSDADTYNRTKAALTQAAAENLNSAVEGAASYVALGLNGGAEKSGRSAAAKIGRDTLTPRAIGLDGTKAPGFGVSSATLPATLPYSADYEAPSTNAAPGLRRPRYSMGMGGYSGRRIGL